MSRAKTVWWKSKMEERKRIKLQLMLMVLVGIVLTVFAAFTKNTIIAIIVFVAQGTLGSVLNAKYRNEVFREISELDQGIYNDLCSVADISPKTAKKEGRDYGETVDSMLIDYMRVQKLNTWMPIVEVLVFFILQIVLFANI